MNERQRFSTTARALFLLLLLPLATLAAAQNATSSTLAKPPEPGKWQWFWINRVEKFRAENQNLDPEQRYVVFLGDSLTQGFHLDQYFPGKPVLNRGVGSDGLTDFPGGRNIWRGVTRRMKESIYDCRPSHVFFMIGTNDLGPESIPIEYWFGTYKWVIEQTRAAFPDVEIIVITCPPTGMKYSRHERLNRRLGLWNDVLRAYAAEEGMPLIDFDKLLENEDGMMPDDISGDGLHFGKPGYEILAAEVRKIMDW